MKILIVRFSSIGDIVLTSPVIRCVKEQLINSEVHFLTKKQFSSVVDNNPHINKVWTIEKEITEVVKELKNEKFDFIIDLHHNLRTYRLKNNLKTKSSSFPKLNFEKWLMVNFKINRLPSKHIVDRYFETVKDLGVKNDYIGLNFFIAPENEIDYDLLPSNFRGNYISFAIGAQLQTKKLPLEKIKDICLQLKLPIILLGGKEDEITGNEISKINPDLIFNLCGKLNLQQSASVIKQSSLVICHDSGLMHIGSAFKKKTISIWGNTIPEFGMFPYQPGNEKNCKIIQVENLSCRPCSKIGYNVCPKKHFNCMNQISNEKIVAAVHEMITVAP